MILTPILEKHRDKWHLDPDTGCYIWDRGKNGGYGTVQHSGKTKYVHRLVLEESAGPPKEGQEARHIYNCKCVNPEHLAWGTRSENAMDRPSDVRLSIARKATLASVNNEEIKGYIVIPWKSKPYQARIKIGPDNKIKYLGSFSTAEEANAAYANAARLRDEGAPEKIELPKIESPETKGYTFYPNKPKPYVARIRAGDGRRVFLGCFDTAEEAHAAYVEAVKRKDATYGA